MRFESLLLDVKGRGVAFAPNAIDEEFLECLNAEITTLQYSEQAVDSDSMQLKFAASKVILPNAQLPALNTLGSHLGWQARLHRGLNEKMSEWSPNEATVQQYRDGSESIGAHRDYKTDLLLIAVVTTAGYGRFEVLSDDGAKVRERYETGPGSLVLLWASGFSEGDGDKRPLHRALAPVGGARTSVTYRLAACDG
ncbi:MAG: hypothetical protein ABIS59_02810 [Candidatus Saccharibacteria bacterium]